MTTTDKLTKLISQLAGDIRNLNGVTVAKDAEGQLVQLLTDAAEDIGKLAIDEFEEVNRPTPVAGGAANFIGDD